MEWVKLVVSLDRPILPVVVKYITHLIFVRKIKQFPKKKFILMHSFPRSNVPIVLNFNLVEVPFEFLKCFQLKLKFLICLPLYLKVYYFFLTALST